MCKQLAQWNSGATRDSNRGFRVLIPSALTTRPPSHTNCKSNGSGVRGLQTPKIWRFPLTLIVAITAVLRSTVLHSDKSQSSKGR